MATVNAASKREREKMEIINLKKPVVRTSVPTFGSWGVQFVRTLESTSIGITGGPKSPPPSTAVYRQLSVRMHLHVPKKGEFTRYPFATFCIDQAILECTEDEVGAINESFKAIFGWRTCTTGDSILDIEERGKHGIGAVADLLEGYLKKYRDKKGTRPNAVLVKWVEDISAGCSSSHIYLLKVGNTSDVLELDPDINLNAPCLRNVLPTSASEASAAVVFAALVESPTAPRPASNVDGAEKDVNEIDWDTV
ncbi:hypothetical protein IW261DRAFT_1589351 [Armillaria novae-zelandiae]|uniref:Uncharacterized protein n=1 Tax=Armillaria novae-zelandiae TaxID=153914 RepID=A0AA39THL3_9AGAR|nr:hypothetical protein IW261DRAFT_1589351 [Armillaria novae-zelandiae]